MEMQTILLMTAQTHLTINEVGGIIVCYHCGHTFNYIGVTTRWMGRGGGIKADMEAEIKPHSSAEV